MSAQQQSYITTGYASGAGSPITAGQCVVLDVAGTYYGVSTSAQRTAVARRTSGIAISSCSGTGQDRAFSVQYVGEIPPSITGLGAGTTSLVRVSTAGVLERVGSYSTSDDVCGYCDVDGTAHVCFPLVGLGAALSSITIAAGDGVRVTNTGSAYIVHGVRGTCSIEQFGAVGDGTTDDSAALTAALAAITAGTYGTLVLGAKTYLVTAGGSFTIPSGCTIIGQGWRSVLKTTANVSMLQVASGASDVHLHDFKMLGNSTGASQIGVQSGVISTGGSSASRGTFRGLLAENFGKAGYLVVNSNQEGPQAGIMLESCFARNCVTYGFWWAGGEYCSMIACAASGCGVGNYMGAANSRVVGCDFSENTTGVEVTAGGNDAHSGLLGCTINHCNTNSVVIDAGLLHPFEITGCFIYQGSFIVGAGQLVSVSNTEFNPTTFSNAGRVRFLECACLEDFATIPTTTSIAESGSGWTEFVNCRGRDDSIPDWVSRRVQRAVSFAIDANRTLTAQESVAETIIVAAGTITASRLITNYFAPATKRNQRIVNNTAFVLTYAWSTGTSVSVAAGAWSVVGSDGTNAILLASPGAGGGGSASVGSSGQIDVADGSGGWSAATNVTGGANFLSVNGGTPIASGVKIANAYKYLTKSSAGTEVPLIYRDASDNVFVGDSTTASTNVDTQTGASVNLRVNGTTVAFAQATSLTSNQPILVPSNSNYVGVGNGTLASVGYIRFPNPSTTTIGIAFKNTGAGDIVAIASNGTANNLSVGGDPAFGNKAVDLYLLASSTVQTVVGSAARQQIDATTIRFGNPIGGLSNPWQWRSTSLVFSAADITLSAAQSECPILQCSGTTGDIIAPNVAGSVFLVQTGTNPRNVRKSGGTGITIPSSLARQLVYHNGTDYVAMAPGV